MFKCDRCSYETKFIGNLRAHFLRVTSCQDTNNCGKTCDDLLKIITKDRSDYKYTCEFCEKSYKSKQAKYLHKKTCKSKIAYIEERPNLKERIENNRDHIKNNNGYVRDFGKEEYSYLMEDDDFLDSCMERLKSGVVKDIAEKMYFNKEHPENKTILLKSMRDCQLMIYKNNEWKIESMEKVIPIIINKVYEIIVNHFQKYKQTYVLSDYAMNEKLRTIASFTSKSSMLYKQSTTAIKVLLSDHRANGAVLVVL